MNRTGSHTAARFTVWLVWATTYRYDVLVGEIKPRCGDLLMQICAAEDVQLLNGVISQEHVHLHLKYPPSISISDLVKWLKGRTSRLVQRDHPHLEKR